MYNFKHEMDYIEKISSGVIIKVETKDFTMVIASGDGVDEGSYT